METRSRSKKRLAIEPQQEEYISSSSSEERKSKPAKKTKIDNLSEITEEQCDAFLEDPGSFKFRNIPITLFSPLFHNIIQICETKYNKKFDKHKFFTNIINRQVSGTKFCINFINLMRIDNNKQIAFDLFTNQNVEFKEHDYLQTALDECEKRGVLLIRLPIPPNIDPAFYKYHENRPFLILNLDYERNNMVVLSNYEDFRSILVAWLEYGHTQRATALTQEVIKNLMDIINLIFKYNYVQSGDLAEYYDNDKRAYIVYDPYDDLQKINSELAFMYYGVKLKYQDLESSEPNSKNRSKSLSSSKKKNLPELPKKSRQELLQEIETTCKEVIDIFSQSEFKKLKKKQLQLIVKVGQPHDGKQNCYKVEGLYNHILRAIKENLPIRDPLNKAHTLTEAEIREVETKIKYLNREAPPLKNTNEILYPNVDILFTQVALENGNFYLIQFKRVIGDRIQWINNIGYLPDVDTEDADINTGTIILRLKKLMDERKLLDPYFIPRIHLNKSPEYWNLANPEETQRKLRLMSDEIRTYE